MLSSRSWLRLTAVPLGFVAFVAPTAAFALDDCPAGSSQKSVDGYTWCEPSVCDGDGQCGPNEVCRPIPLCVQVGTLKATSPSLADAGQRLVATQRCAADKTCPSTTVCSDKSRCVGRAQADKMGLLSAPAGSAGGAGATDTSTPTKKSCGCHVPGTRGGAFEGAALAALATGLVIARRRRTAR